MINGLTGIKIGMTRHFTTKGVAIPVTVIKVRPHQVVYIKTLKRDGYSAFQITVGAKKTSRVNKPELGHFGKTKVVVGNRLCEFRSSSDSDEKLINVGQIITVSLFNAVKKVDITGISKGKGFSGTIKRWNFRSQDASHGNSLSHRVPGSIGQNQTPGKVFKGKKMPGQLGNVQVTVQNLDIIFIDLENELLFVKGSVPGEINSLVRIQVSKKSFKES